MQALGYKKPATACYVLCSKECQDHQDEHGRTREELEEKARAYDHVRLGSSCLAPSTWRRGQAGFPQV